MKTILGLDLGSASIGWAVVGEYEDKSKILDMGSRIIPLSVDDATQFTQGKTITKNADRTQKRTQRKGYDRYQLRRYNLRKFLQEFDMLYGEDLIALRSLELWGLRARAAKEQLGLPELGRVFFHLNQKRGYKSVKEDSNDKKQTAYVQAINSRYSGIKERGVTIGQYFFEELSRDTSFRCKDNIFPRAAYVEEFDRVIAVQREFYPHIFTDKNIDRLRNEIIYYQRPLKSCKHLVSRCELEQMNCKEGEKAPRVAPRSAPLFQVCKIWETINNLALRNKYGNEFEISLEQKRAIFEFMNRNEKLKMQNLYSILGIRKNDGWLADKSLKNGLQGNITYVLIANALRDEDFAEEILKFDVKITDSNFVDEDSGEIIPIVDSRIDKEPLNRLWHILYSVTDIDELRTALKKPFVVKKADGEFVSYLFKGETIERLCQIDFVKMGYGNKSIKAIRRILPFLMRGNGYHSAQCMAGYKERSLTIEENANRVLLQSLPLIQKGELRQPIVEKILNQLVNIINALMAEYGNFDEIRVELARELKQSRDEREEAFRAMGKNKTDNEKYAKRIKEDYGLTPTRSRIQKYKMWEESVGVCMYCGSVVNVEDFLRGYEVEVEHIIPKSLLFDDSFSNKVCACRKCNQEKGNSTAYDYMESKGKDALEAYVDRVNDSYAKHKISKAKFNKLLMPASKIPTDFIDRQLRETQYVAKKAKEMLQMVSRNVHATSGSVTDFLRHIWDWDKVLHTLNLEKYKAGGLTEVVAVEHKGCKYEEERILDWSKRLDHRHHAIDALVVACTKQGYIQRLNNLSSLKDVAFAPADSQGKEYREKLSKLERYILSQPHISTAEVQSAVENILVSFKAGKRVATIGKRYAQRGGKRVLAQTGIVIPRGPLSEESVYGCIKTSDKKDKTKIVNEYVIKYPLDSIDAKCVSDIIDGGIRRIVEARLNAFGGDKKKAFAEPLLDHCGRVIRSVRCRTGLSAVEAVRYNEQSEPEAFVKPGNNHHIAIYAGADGKTYEHVVTFWHAVERKKHKLPVIIENTNYAWEMVTDEMSENFISHLPQRNSELLLSMSQNEMFILGMSDDDYNDALRNNNYALLSKHLYRVQKISKSYYVFRHHLETSVDDKYNGVKNEALSMHMGKLKSIRSIGSLMNLNPRKVKITVTGKIVEND